MSVRHYYVVAGAVLLAGLLATPAPGDAATRASIAPRPNASARAVSDVTVRDLRGDMIKIQEGAEEGTPAPNATVGDVLHTTFRHTNRRVVVRTHLAALRRTGRASFTMWVDIQRGTHRTWIVGVTAPPRHRRGQVIFMTDSGRDVNCAVAHHLAYPTDVVQVAVPRRCLGTPHRVRFRLLTENFRPRQHYAWLDNGLAAHLNNQHWTRWLVPD